MYEKKRKSENILKENNLKIFPEPITSIPGGPELYIDMGSTVNLTCIVKHLPDPPLTVHWTHNNEVNNTKIFLFTF